MIRQSSYDKFSSIAALADEAEQESSSGGSDDESSYSNYDDSSESSSVEDGGALDILMSSATTDEKASGLFMSLEMVKMLRLSTSDGNLAVQAMEQMAVKMTPPPRRFSEGACAPKMTYAMQTKSAMESHAHLRERDADIPKPRDTLKKIIIEKGLEPKYFSSDEIAVVFTKGSVSDYSLRLMNAVRQNDLPGIRKYHEEGNSLQCCNKFGESSIHAMARRGDADIVKYFIDVAKCSVRVCCDGGRTPLHDAAWTAFPKFDAIRILLDDCPDFLMVKDKRGFTPLDFVPKEAHEVWNEFLNGNKDLVTPTGILSNSVS